MTLPTEEELEAEREMEMEAALAAAADAKASRELEVAEEYAMELEREREREGEPDAELAATVEAGAGTPSSPSPRRRVLPLPPSPSLDGAPPPPIEEFSDDEPGDAGPRPPLVPPPPARPPSQRPPPPSRQRRERERQLLRDQRRSGGDHDDGQASESDGEPPRATRLELRGRSWRKDNKSKKEAAIQDALRLFVKNNVRPAPLSCAPRPLEPEAAVAQLLKALGRAAFGRGSSARTGTPARTMKEVIQLLAMTFHKTYESNPGSFEFTFSKEVLSGRTRTFVEESLQLEDVCPEMPSSPASPSPATRISWHGSGTRLHEHLLHPGRLPAGIEEATETCDWPTVYGMLHPFMPNVVKHLADNGYVTADEFGYAAAVLYAFNLYCGIIKGQSGTGKSMVTQIMTECLPPGRVCVYRPSKGSAFSSTAARRRSAW
eukprot:tig00021251_g19650.t1